MSVNIVKREPVDFGRNDVDRSLRYTGHVVGGGAVTPWVNVVTGYDTLCRVRWEDDFRSGSKRSGSIVWQLDENELYVMRGVAVSSRASETFYVSTYDGVTEVLDAKKFRAALRRLYPAGAELAAVKAEQARVAQEAAAAAQVEAEKARLVRMQEEAARREATRLEREATLAAEAEKIETEGQVVVEGLPLLKGTPKQVAWATKIRDAVRAKEPKNPALRRASKAAYWIENYRTALPR